MPNTLQGLLSWSPCGVLDSNKQTRRKYMLDGIGYQDKGYKGQCLDCGLDIYAQKFDTVNEQCEGCKE
tara:strand:+ start:311 stop:514 length:204 start_codon:yes stop_codon:yes gene_type:complete